MVTEPIARRVFQVAHQEFVASLASQKAVQRALTMFGEVAQAQRPLGRLLMLEQRSTSAIQCAYRGEAGRRNSEFNAYMSQHTRRNHLNGIERRSGEPQKTDLQRHTQSVQRPPSAIDSPLFLFGKREEIRNFRVGQIVREPLPTKVLLKWSVHDSILPRLSLHSAGKRSRNLRFYLYQ